MRMPFPMSLLATVLAAAIAALAPAFARAGALDVGASAASSTSIRLSWSWWEDPSYPTGHPEWVGYDLYRRASAGCGEWVRLNPDLIARVPGQTQSCSWLDTTPTPATAWTYQVRLVDANRDAVLLPPPACTSSPCSPPGYAACPDASAPLVVGAVTDWGWAVQVTGCADGCWGAFYVANPAADALRPYAGSGQAVALYGTAQCGTVEGCALQLDHFELAACGSTPVRRSTWGTLKSRYR